MLGDSIWGTGGTSLCKFAGCCIFMMNFIPEKVDQCHQWSLCSSRERPFMSWSTGVKQELQDTFTKSGAGAHTIAIVR